MASATDRKNQQIWDAVEVNNLKQALQLCTKRIKKGEKGDYLQALRAFVLTQWPSAAQRKEGFAEAKRLAEKDPAITDSETLSLLRRCFTDLGGEHALEWNTSTARDYVTILWERALKANPGDENLARECFFSYLEQRNWKNAQKVRRSWDSTHSAAPPSGSTAMLIQRTFNQKREYYFWAILCCHLLHISSDTSEADRKLFGNLAYKLIAKSASEVPVDPQDLLSPGRSITTPQELHLLLTIFRTQNDMEGALRILDSPNLGIHSTIAKGDWSFVRQKLDILEERKLWQDVWDFCKESLQASHASPTSDVDTIGSPSQVKDADDWRIWEALIRANREINRPETDEETRKVIRSYSDRPSPGRNAQLAHLLYARAKSVPESIEDDHSTLLSACRQYFERAATKICCYDDLRHPIGRLDAETQKGFLEHAYSICDRMHSNSDSDQEKSLSSIAAQVNAMKLRFHIQISQDCRRLSTQGVASFIDDCIKLYATSLSSQVDGPLKAQPGDDACILAVMALIHLSRVEKDSGQQATLTSRLLQAAVLLEFLISRSTYNYRALLILVRVYAILGCGSLAFNTYFHLSIKHIQHDTLSHNMFTRISTTHPCPFLLMAKTAVEKKHRDPLAGLERALKIYRKSESQISAMVKLAVEEGSYNQVPDFLDLGVRMNQSITKYMCAIESRRILRLLGGNGSTIPAIEIQAQELPLPQLLDHRNDDVIPSFEGLEKPPFEECIRLGPKPGSEWVTAFTISEHLLTNLCSCKDSASEYESIFDSTSNVGDLVQQLKDILQADDVTMHFTNAELLYLELFCCVFELARPRLNGSADTKSLHLSITESLDVWLMKKINNTLSSDVVNGTHAMQIAHRIRVPDWEILHDTFITLDALKMITILLRKITPQGRAADTKTLRATVVRIKGLVMQVYQGVRSQLMKFKNGLSESGSGEKLVDLMLERREHRQDIIGRTLEGLIGRRWIQDGFIARVISSWQEALDGGLRVKID